jgi:hypothetical protein
MCMVENCSMENNFMTTCKWATRLLKIFLCVAPGSMLMGGGCGPMLRDSIVAAGMDFVRDATYDLLQALIPVEQIVGGS